MPWLQVRLAITPEQAETYEDALLEVGAVSVTFMDAEDQPIFEPDLGTTPLWSHTHLLALFEANTDETALIAHLQLLCGGSLPEHHVERIEDQDWERSWMDNFQPMRFGQRLWIVPSWHAAPEPDAVAAVAGAEAELVAELNAGHAAALAAAGARLSGGRTGVWRLLGLDVDGADLGCEEAVVRLPLPVPATSPEALRDGLLALL